MNTTMKAKLRAQPFISSRISVHSPTRRVVASSGSRSPVPGKPWRSSRAGRSRRTVRAGSRRHGAGRCGPCPAVPATARPRRAHPSRPVRAEESANCRRRLAVTGLARSSRSGTPWPIRVHRNSRSAKGRGRHVDLDPVPAEEITEPRPPSHLAGAGDPGQRVRQVDLPQRSPRRCRAPRPPQFQRESGPPGGARRILDADVLRPHTRSLMNYPAFSGNTRRPRMSPS